MITIGGVLTWLSSTDASDIASSTDKDGVVLDIVPSVDKDGGGIGMITACDWRTSVEAGPRQVSLHQESLSLQLKSRREL